MAKLRVLAIPQKDKKDYDTSTGEGQKRLMYDSIGIDITQKPKVPAYYQEGEYGHDPILDDQGNPTGKIRMVPTGRVIDVATGKEVQGTMTKLRVLAQEDLEDDTSFAPHSFCREELKEVLSRVHTYLPRSETKEAWVDRTSPITKRDSPYFYFHFQDFTWDGTADCSFQAKAKGWEAWLEKNHPEEEPLWK